MSYAQRFDDIAEDVENCGGVTFPVVPVLLQLRIAAAACSGVIS